VPDAAGVVTDKTVQVGVFRVLSPRFGMIAGSFPLRLRRMLPHADRAVDYRKQSYVHKAQIGLDARADERLLCRF
jgi:hypothetical protein